MKKRRSFLLNFFDYPMDGIFRIISFTLSLIFKTETQSNMTSTNQECPMSPKRAEEFEKEWEELHERFYEAFKENWEELHEEVLFNEDPYKKSFKEKQSFLVRLRRAISWLDKAQQMEKDVKETDKDLAPQFIFFWIGFNALYARDPDRFLSGLPRRGPDKWIEGEKQSEKKEFRNYFRYLLKFDNAEDRVHKIIRSNISEEIISLSKNKFVGESFWNSHHDIKKKIRWKLDGPLPRRSKQNTNKVLTHVFKRLYVLRNQLMHGAATWDGHLNKKQLSDGTKIMHWLLPVFIEIMLETPEDKWKGWGRVYFPRVAKEPILRNGNEA